MVPRPPDALACADVCDAIDAHLSGRLVADRGAAIEAHIESCPACRDELELAAAIRRELSALPRFDAPPQVVEAVRRRVLEATPAPVAIPTGRSAVRTLRARMALAGAAAAAIVGAIVVLSPSRSSGPSQPVPAVAIARATAEARFAFSLVGNATATAQHELRQEVLQERVVAAALRGLSRAIVAHPRSSSVQGSHPTPNVVHGGSS